MSTAPGWSLPMTIVTACDSLSDGIVIIDDHKSVSYLNQTARRLVGMARGRRKAGALCRNLLRCGSLDEPNRLCADCRVDHALRHGAPTPRFEAAIGAPNRRVLVEVSCSPIPGEQPSAMLVLRQRPQEVESTRRPGLELSAQSHTMLQSLVQLARDLLQSDYAALGRLDLYRLEMVWLVQDGSQSPTTAFSRTPIGRGIRGRVISTKQPVCINHFPEGAPDLPEHHPTMQAEQLQTALAVPVMIHDEPNGVLMVARRQTAEYGPQETQVLRSFADFAAEVLRHTDWVMSAQASAVHAEREWLAAEMHDGLAQLLAAVSQRLKLTCWVMEHDGDRSQLAADLHDILELSEQATKELRLSLGELRTAVAEGDFFAALHDTLSTFTQRSAMRVELVEVPERRPPIPPPIALQILRIIQEALGNARKHSRGSCVWVSWTHASSEHTFTIKDDGTGFLTDQAAQGFGLSIMADRARRIGGQLKVLSAPESGCTVILTVPDGIEGVWASESDPSAAG